MKKILIHYALAVIILLTITGNKRIEEPVQQPSKQSITSEVSQTHTTKKAEAAFLKPAVVQKQITPALSGISDADDTSETSQTRDRGPVTIASAKAAAADNAFEAEVSAYTAGFESTGKNPDHEAYGITASGKKVKENHTIACPRSIAFGTLIYIPKLATTYVCEDRGSKITKGKLDIYMADLQDALAFGRQKLEVQIVMP